MLARVSIHLVRGCCAVLLGIGLLAPRPSGAASLVSVSYDVTGGSFGGGAFSIYSGPITGVYAVYNPPSGPISTPVTCTGACGTLSFWLTGPSGSFSAFPRNVTYVRITPMNLIASYFVAFGSPNYVSWSVMAPGGTGSGKYYGGNLTLLVSTMATFTVGNEVRVTATPTTTPTATPTATPSPTPTPTPEPPIALGPCPSGPVVPDTGDPGSGFFPNAKTVGLNSSDPVTVPWCLRASSPTTRVVGVLFVVHYDSSEIDLLNTAAPPPLNSNMSPFATYTPTWVVPLSQSFSPLSSMDPGMTSNTRVHLGWVAGTTMMGLPLVTSLFPTTSRTFASFDLQARHTTWTSLNGDADLSVVSAFLIQHASTFQSGIASVWSSVSEVFNPVTLVFTSQFYVPFGTFYQPFSYSQPFGPFDGIAAHLGLEHFTPTPTPTPSVSPTPSASPTATPVPDSDSDGIPDPSDNCPFVPNNMQENSDPLPAGDACQCGDLDEDGVVDAMDVELARKHVVGATPALSQAALDRCNLIEPSGGAAECDVADVFVLRRAAAGHLASAGTLCETYGAP